MNIFNIAILHIKRDFRDIRTLVFMLAFPIVLMLVLGTALSNAFNSDSHSIKDIQVLYKDEASSAFSQAFEEFAKKWINRVFILKSFRRYRWEGSGEAK